MKKCISIIMALAIVLSVVSVSVYAKECDVKADQEVYKLGTFMVGEDPTTKTYSMTITNYGSTDVFVMQEYINSGDRQLIDFSNFNQLAGEKVAGVAQRGTITISYDETRGYAYAGTPLAAGESYTFDIKIARDSYNNRPTLVRYEKTFSVWDKRPIQVNFGTNGVGYYDIGNGAKELGTIDCTFEYKFTDNAQYLDRQPSHCENQIIVTGESAETLQANSLNIDYGVYEIPIEQVDIRTRSLGSESRHVFSTEIEIVNNSAIKIALGEKHSSFGDPKPQNMTVKTLEGYKIYECGSKEIDFLNPGESVVYTVTSEGNGWGEMMEGSFDIAISDSKVEDIFATSHITATGAITTTMGVPVEIRRQHSKAYDDDGNYYFGGYSTVEDADKAYTSFGTGTDARYEFFVPYNGSRTFKFVLPEPQGQYLELDTVYDSSVGGSGKDVSAGPNNTYTLHNVKKPVTIYTRDWKVSNATPKTVFTDVPANAYYENAVKWASDNDVTKGTSLTEFSPNESCTRGQVVTFLWRANGCPKPQLQKNPFKDVKKSDYYYEAVLWAIEKGITQGTSTVTFSPDEACTNSHIITFIYRAVGEPGKTENPETWYADSMNWASANNLIKGTYVGTFNVEGICPRCNTVEYLYRYMNK